MPSTLQLTAEEQAIFDGKQGEFLHKIMKTAVNFSELFGVTN